MATVIEILAQKVLDTFGIENRRNYLILKSYIQKLSETELLSEIEKVTNPRIFPILFSVGLPFEIQKAIVKKAKELE